MILFENLYKSFKGKNALKNVNFLLKKGEIYALVGSGGSGKTTIINLIRYLLVNYEGTIKIGGKDIKKSNSYLETFFFMESKLNSFEGIKNLKELSKMLNFFKNFLPEEQFIKTPFFLENLTNIMDKKIHDLSAGWKKVILISKLFRMKKIDFLILDEPYEELDIEFCNILTKKIRELVKGGAGVLISSHNPGDLKNLTDNFIILNEGKIKFFGKSNNIEEEYKFARKKQNHRNSENR